MAILFHSNTFNTEVKILLELRIFSIHRQAGTSIKTSKLNLPLYKHFLNKSGPNKQIICCYIWFICSAYYSSIKNCLYDVKFCFNVFIEAPARRLTQKTLNYAKC